VGCGNGKNKESDRMPGRADAPPMPAPLGTAPIRRLRAIRSRPEFDAAAWGQPGRRIGHTQNTLYGAGIQSGYFDQIPRHIGGSMRVVIEQG
jgi:hypothetical protein